MQHVVAIDVVRERKRHAFGHAAEHDRRSRKTIRRIAFDVFEEILHALAKLDAKLVHHLLALAPGQHEEGDNQGDEQGEPAAVEQLGRGRGEEQQVEREKAAVDRVDDDWIVLPMQRYERRHQRGDDHQQRHRNAECASERIRRAEADDGSQSAGRERPIDERHVDLADLAPFGVDDPHARQEAERNGLLGHRIGAGDDRLGGDDGRDRRKNDERIMRPLRRKLIERAVEARWARSGEGRPGRNN